MNTSNATSIVLVEPSHPGNIGAAARAAKTMGIESLVLVNPKRFPDPEATVRAVDAADILERAVVCTSLKEAVCRCTFVVGTSVRKRGLPCPQILPRQLGSKVRNELERGPVAIVFGRESSGLSNEELDLCQYVTAIPSMGSLNLAAAVQVICYEIFMATGEPDSVDCEDELATSMELERLFEHLQTVLLEIGFLDPRQPKLLMRRLRHIYQRARLTQVEVNILRGILSATQNPTSQ
ncbi:MAG: RNA methyltransferase [Gammaproteobacteria bacterium]|nr:RNA methyltransferase [Gammaproteobacteria bacterium]